MSRTNGIKNSDTEGLAEAVQEAYESNKGDVWGVDVYFMITKNID